MARPFLRLAVAALATFVLHAAPAARQQPPDRSSPPPTGPPPSLKLPAIEKRSLGNGLPVWIVEMHEVPVVDVMLLVKSGAASDPSEAYGTARVTADMLDEGAGGRSALELADAVDLLGASLSTGATFDASTVRLHVLRARLDQALPLMADVVLRPAFPDAELERVRKSRLTALVQARDNPSALASIAFPRLLYGTAHRYGTPAGGTETSLGELAVADLRRFHDAYYRPANAHLLVVGDTTAAEVLPKLEQAFGGWSGGGAVPPPALPAASQPEARHIYLIDKPGAAQSQIRMGWVGVPRSTPDYFVLDVVNTVLGGSFTSRLNQNLREEHGYSYGAGSSFDMRVGPGPFVAAAGVQTDKTVPALQEFFKELERIREPIPPAELEKAKDLEALSFPAAFETTSGMAGQLAELVIYGLPESFFTDYVPKIQAVTVAEAQRAAAQYIQPDRFAVVVVGDVSAIEPAIRAANLGPVTVVPVDDVMK